MQVQHQRKFLQLLQRILLIYLLSCDIQIEKKRKSKNKKNAHYYSLLCLLPLQSNPQLQTVNLKTIPSTFTLTHPSTDKFIFATHPRYTVIIRRF